MNFSSVVSHSFLISFKYRTNHFVFLKTNSRRKFASKHTVFLDYAHFLEYLFMRSDKFRFKVTSFRNWNLFIVGHVRSCYITSRQSPSETILFLVPVVICGANALKQKKVRTKLILSVWLTPVMSINKQNSVMCWKLIRKITLRSHHALACEANNYDENKEFNCDTLPPILQNIMICM